MSAARRVRSGALAVLGALGCASAQAARAPAVRIYHDELGIPHVFAATDAGVFRGLGYSQVRDFPVATLANLWSASGRYAEVAGAMVLERDQRIRQWGIDRIARELAADATLLDERPRAWLQAYVDGVNEGRRAWLAHPEALDALVGGQGELFLDPVPPWLDPQRTRDDPRARVGRLFECELGLEHVLALGVALAAGPEFGAAGYATRTNVMMLRGGERDPVTHVLADVHQPLQEFGYRTYFVQLAGPGYDLVGNSSPGFPCIVLGASRSVAFGSMTLPKTPRELTAAGLPFRIDDDLPLVRAAWTARLEADAPARLARGAETLPLVEEVVMLRFWDATEKELADDPRGPLTLRWVRDDATELLMPVLDPPPTQPLDLAARPAIRFEARSFFGQRSLWETWIELGTCERVGSKEGGIERVLAREALAAGRGQVVLAADVTGGFELLWGTRAARTSAKALELTVDGAVLDGHDPEQRWQGFHGFADLPRWVGGARGKGPAAWIECNSSPHFVREGEAEAPFDGPRAVWDREPWKSRRQDRAWELWTRAASDGVLETAELEQLALDVQDGWSRRSWPWIHALLADAEPALSERARSFVQWLEVYRFEGPDGKPGEEEFLAHPLSQVMPFLVLVRDRYEDELVAAAPSADQVALAFDPGASAPPEEFLAGERYAKNRAALRTALEWTAELRERTLLGTEGGIADADFYRDLAGRTKDCGAILPRPWSDPLYLRQAEEWGPLAPAVPLRWGHVNVYALTPHRPRFDPDRARPALIENWLSAIFAPCEVLQQPRPYYRAHPAAVFPIGGTHDSLFQVHREGFLSYSEGLLPCEKGLLYLAPADFGSQTLFLAELAAGERPRVRVLMALAPTEILCELPALGARALDLFRPTARFARGEWSDVLTDEDALRALEGVRRVELGE
jgi:hypothetical protein